MARKKNIKIEFTSSFWAIGIASNERIWKLCWEVNRTLEIEMAAGTRDLTQAGSGEFYVDKESNSEFEYCLLENTFKKKGVPALARQFRYWLIIKPHIDKEPNIESYIGKLKEVTAISLSVDLSEQKELNKLLPWI